MIGVVIPFFQRNPGLLRRSILSIEQQAGAGEVRVYVVDDASPAPIAREIEGLAMTEHVTVLKRPNQGPGAARNTAIDHLAPEIEIVAFLDSDDVWMPGHLGRVRRAMAAGADFYFADYKRDTQPQSQFGLCGFSPAGPPIDSEMRELMWCDVRSVARAVLVRSPVGTSTVAVRRSFLSDLRFLPELRSFGEDIVLWSMLLARSPRTVCSAAIEALYGSGVNIAEHGSWGDDRAVRTIADQLRLQAYLRKHFVFDPDVLEMSEAHCSRLEVDLCASIIASCRRLKAPPLSVVAGALRHRPLALLRFPEALGRSIAAKLR